MSAEALNPEPQVATLRVPDHFPAVERHLDNPLTVEGIELGRQLFYDVRLSGNNKISCASCHQQNLAFSDGVALGNQGVSATQLHRHAPALFNLAWSKSGLFWDGGAKNLESQAFGPLTAADEMHQDLYELDWELKQIPEYVKSFRLVFGGEVSSANVVKALAQFQRSLISAGSKYDRYQQGEKNASLTALELEGMALVAQKCQSCHSGELFTDDAYHNNGLDGIFSEDFEGIFQGRFRVSFEPVDLGKFKTPSLRNVLLTAPYMHDGRFKTIDEVLDHYQSGVKISATTDAILLKNASQPGIAMSANERKAIIAFLGSLSDHELINNQEISNPHE